MKNENATASEMLVYAEQENWSVFERADQYQKDFQSHLDEHNKELYSYFISRSFFVANGILEEIRASSDIPARKKEKLLEKFKRVQLSFEQYQENKSAYGTPKDYKRSFATIDFFKSLQKFTDEAGRIERAALGLPSLAQTKDSIFKMYVPFTLFRS